MITLDNLPQNNYTFTLTEEEAYQFVIKIASSNNEFENIVDYIQSNVKRIK